MASFSTTNIVLLVLAIGFATVHASAYKLILLQDAHKCNDGSPPGFYINILNNASNNWMLYFEGGGWCFSEESCESRWKNSKGLMSSSVWSPTANFGGMLSEDPKINPVYHSYNKIFIKYCSSDSFSGSSSLHNSNRSKWIFDGALITKDITTYVIATYGVGSAGSKVLITGASAGAEGAFINVDAMAAMLPDADVKCFLDSGWFMDFEPFKNGPCRDAGSCTEQEGMRRGAELWYPISNKGCMAQHTGGDAYLCLLAPYVYSHLKTNTFVFMFSFDSAQLGHQGIYHIPSTTEEKGYAIKSQQNLTMTMAATGVRYVFSPACYRHTITGSDNWNAVVIGDKNLSDLLALWEREPNGAKYYVDVCHRANCNPTCK